MGKLDKMMPDYSNRHSRTAHDMSHGLKFTCASGHINPVEHDVLLPGDTVYLGFDFVGRNQMPFLSPASADLDFHVDYFFVPMELLFKPFASYVYGVKDEYSSFFQMERINLPNYPFNGIYSYMYQNRIKKNLDTKPEYAQVSYESVGKSFLRLMGLLGFPDYFKYLPSDLDSLGTGRHLNFSIPNTFPAAILAYNCIYQYYFRNEDVEEFNQRVFNLDSDYMSGVVSLGTDRYDSMRIKYCNAYKDYFTAVRRSPLINQRNLLNEVDYPNNSNLLSVFDDLGVSDVNLVGQNLISDLNPSTINFSSPLSVFQGGIVEDDGNNSRTTDQYRKLFAVEKLLMVTQRARKNYDAQTLAHFGFKVPHDARHQISHLGHEVSTMHIGEITALAGSNGDDNGNVQFGDYAGRGAVSHKAKGVKFTAPCHGIVMTTLRVVPRYDYFTDFLKKNLLQNRLNFFQPEFDHLGMQPLYLWECELPANLPNSSESVTFVEGSEVNQYIPNDSFAFIQGWQFRYEEKKRQYNRATSAFKDGPLASWIMGRRPFNRQYQGLSYVSDWDDTPWTLDGSSYYETIAKPWLVMPTDTDGLFLGSYELDWRDDFLTHPEQIYETDPFVLFAYSRYKKVSIMSTYSMPELD